MNHEYEDLRGFENPPGNWSHDGKFSVELTDDADHKTAPPNVRFVGNTVHVDSGRVAQGIGGIQLYAYGQPFWWGYAFLKVIRDGKGKPIWVNWDISHPRT